MKLLRNISELLTLSKAKEKSGRFPQEDDLSILKNGCVCFRNGKIIWVGKDSDLNHFLKENSLDKLPVSEEYDCYGHSVLPSFVESHTHSVFSGNRINEFEMRNSGMSYSEIHQMGGGIHSTVQSTREESAEKLLNQSQQRINHFIYQGVGTVEVKSGYGLDFETEVKMLNVCKELKGVEIVPTYLAMHACPKNLNKIEYVDQVVNEFLPKIAALGFVNRVDIFIEKGFFDLQDGLKLMNASQNFKMKFSAHVDQLSNTGSVSKLIQKGAVSLDHIVEITHSEIKELSNSDCTGILLPTADFYLKTKYPPARSLIDSGCRVALSTDFNPGSSPSQSLPLVGLLARLEMNMSLAEVLVSYTYNGAKALGKEDHIGSIETGKRADFIVINGSWRELFYQVEKDFISKVFHDGQLMKQ